MSRSSSRTTGESGLRPVRRLVAFESASLDRIDSSILKHINILLSAAHQVLVVELTDEHDGEARLLQADYVLDENGRGIVRGSDHERLEPRVESDSANGISAVLSLATEFMIPESQIYCFTSSVSPSLAEINAQVFLLDGDAEAEPPEVAGNLTPCSPEEIPELLSMVLTTSQPVGDRGRIEDEAFERALDTLHRNVTDLGFTAASLSDNELMRHDENYAAVWSRDGVITGLWTLCVDEPALHKAFRNTLDLVAAHQDDSGQVPSYVRIKDETPDYSGIGGIASIDSALWFVIGAIRYAFHQRDLEFARDFAPHLELAMNWLRAHDSNNDGLLELPESSDWMDLFPRSYNVLYDEVLWYQACLDYGTFLEAIDESDEADEADESAGARWRDRGAGIHSRILDLFWPSGDQLIELAGTSSGRFSLGEARYLLSQVTPFDYSWRCDVFANLLAALTGLLNQFKKDRLFTFLWGVGINSPSPVACLYPPIQSGSDDWKDYFMVNFLNLPDHYHNGGIWPLVGGLWVRFLYDLGRPELAYRELTLLAESCRAGIRGEWEFNEWLHGRTGRPMGKAHQAWSAASYVRAYLTVKDDQESATFAKLDLGQLRSASLSSSRNSA